MYIVLSIYRLLTSACLASVRAHKAHTNKRESRDTLHTQYGAPLVSPVCSRFFATVYTSAKVFTNFAYVHIGLVPLRGADK